MKKLIRAFVLIVMAIPGFAQETITHYLSGTDKDHTVTWDFYVTEGRNSGKWSKIEVPSNWELQGFGNYNYGQDENKSEEQGFYKHTFEASTDWSGKKVFIVFEGVMTDAEVKINGKLAGPIHQGGFYRFKYDITKLIRFGRGNLLEVNVSKASANPSVNRAERDGDFWALGGIFRPVYLEIVPQVYIDRIAIDARADGSFSAEVFGVNVTDKHTIEAQVFNLDGSPFGQSVSTKGEAKAAKIVLRQMFEWPRLWNPEYPNLYKVVVSIKRAGTVVHSVTERFGFRTVEVRRKDGIYVNGTRVLLKGVNRHSLWPESGRTLSRKINRDDILLIKDMNMNAVRMSHYPPDRDFLDLCDSIGLFVMNELTGWQAAYDTEVGQKLVRELVIRDVNHPSIILWNNGNERGWNTDLDDDYALYDPQNRVVLHPIERFNGVDTKHYISYDYLVNSSLYDTDILLPTEFMHGLYDGGHAAGLDEYWALMRRHPTCAGGFLWVLSDGGLRRIDKGGIIDINGNKAPDGIVGPYREKEASYYAIKEIWSPVYIERRYLTPSFDGRLKVENRYLYTNMDQCTFSWKLVTFPDPRNPSTDSKVDAEGHPATISLAPGETGTLDLHLPDSWRKSDALFLTAYDPYKREVFTWSWPIRSAFEIAARDMTSSSATDRVEVSELSGQLIVKADGVSYEFDRSTGYLSKVTSGASATMLSGGPAISGGKYTLKEFKARWEGDTYVVEPVYEGSDHYRVQWSFASGKPAKLNYEYSYKGEVDFMGITFDYPETNIQGMKWLGRGPYRVWKNRLRGQTFSVWQKDYNDTVTGESWDYPEFKGYHSELYWVTVQTTEGPFTVYAVTPGIFLQMLTPAKPVGATNDNTSPPFPRGSIGFMNAISPIGTKFQEAKVMGPASQKNVMLNNTPFKGELWFYFKPHASGPYYDVK